MRKSRHISLSKLEDVRDLFKMSGGAPATLAPATLAPVPVGSTSNGYHQYMGNNPHTNVYGLDGSLAPSALANPIPIKVTNQCASP